MQIRGSCKLANGFSIASLSEYKVHAVTVRVHMCSLIKTLLFRFRPTEKNSCIPISTNFYDQAIVNLE